MDNLVKAGTYTRKASGEKKQMFKCTVCGHRFSETHGTLFAGCHYSDKTINSIIVCISEGNGIRATSGILDCAYVTSKERIPKEHLKDWKPRKKHQLAGFSASNCTQ